MTDPRIGLGLEVEPEVAGPYEVRKVEKPSTNGGTLDVGIIAYTACGKRIVIGEIWAACPDDEGSKTRIDAIAVATRIVDALNWVIA